MDYTWIQLKNTFFSYASSASVARGSTYPSLVMFLQIFLFAELKYLL